MEAVESGHKQKSKWFYGWVIVAVCNLSLMVVFGIRLSFTVFFVALIDEFGWTRADTSLIYSVSMLVFAAVSPLAGIGLDRWGARRTFGLGAAVLSFGLLLSSRVETLPQLTLAYGVVAGLGVTILGLGPQASLISRWFRRRRGLAIGITFAGTGIGSLLLTPGAEYMIRHYSWREAYIGLAVLAFVILPLNVILLRLSPAEKQLHPDGLPEEPQVGESSESREDWKIGEVVRNPGFWLIMLAALGSIGPVRMLTVHQLAIAADAGFERSFASLVIGLTGIFTAIAFILMGVFSDRFGRLPVYIIGSICLVCAMIVIYRIDSPDQLGWLVMYIILLGIGEGSRSSLVTAAASDLFPGNALGAVNGAVGAFFGLGAAIFPWLAGRLYDLQGNYLAVFIFAGTAVLISVLALWQAPKATYKPE